MIPDARLLFEHTTDAVVVLDAQLRIAEVNGRAALMYRKPARELVGRTLVDLFPELRGSAGEAQLADARGARLPRKFEMFVPSLFAWHAVLAVPDRQGLVLFGRDVTDRVRREQEEAVREAVRNIIEHVPVCITITRGPQHRIDVANVLARALVGDRASEGELVETVLPEAREQGFIALLDRVFTTGQPYRGEEMPLTWRGDGHSGPRKRYFDVVYQPLRGAAGEVDGIIHLGLDVTDQVLRRETIARLAAERQAVLEQLTEGVIVTDANGRITLVNEAATRMHGVAVLDVTPDAYAETYHLLTDAGEPHPSEDLPLARAVRTRQPVHAAAWKIRRPDGSILRVAGSAKPVTDADGTLLACVLTFAPAPEADAA